MRMNFQKANSEIPSVYHKALTSYPDIIDLVDLFEQAIHAQGFIESLLNKKNIEIEIKPDSKFQEKIRHLYFSVKNNAKQYGYNSMGIGYPLITFFRNTQVVVAPLFIWHIQLEPVYKAPFKWNLKFDHDQLVRLNPYLHHYWQVFLKWDNAYIQSRFQARTNNVNNTLQILLNELSEQIPLQFDLKDKQISHVPELATLNQERNAASIFWSAVVGAFKPLYQYVPVNVDSFKFNTANSPYPFFGWNQIHPNQSTLLQQLKHTSLAVGDGPDHLQIQTAFQQIIHSLSNGQTVLVTAKSSTQLEKLYLALAALDLHNLSFLWRQLKSDWPLLRQILVNSKRNIDPKKFNSRQFESLLGQLKKEKNKFDQILQTTRGPIFKTFKLNDLVGIYLQNQQIEGRELLGSQLVSQEFDFNESEYEEILKIIQICFGLFKKVKTLKHPLRNLHDDNFAFPDFQEALDNLTDRLERVDKKLSSVHHNYITLTNEYTDSLHEYYEGYYLKLRKGLTTIIEQKAFYSAEYGKDFQLTTVASLKLLGAFSSRYKSMLEAKEELIKNFQQLIKDFQDNSLFEFSFTMANERRNIVKWEEDLKSFEAALESWYEEIDEQCRKEVIRLSPSNINPKIEIQDKVKALEGKLNQVIQQLNKASIFQENLENVMLTTVKQQQFLENIIEKVEQTKVFLKDFEAYFEWRNYWIHLSSKAQKVIRALTKVKPNNWTAAYLSWFFYHKLKLNSTTYSFDRNIELENYTEQLSEMRTLMPLQIQKLWQIKADRIIKEWKQKKRKTYQNLIKEEDWDSLSPEQVSEWLGERMEWVSGQLPVFFIPPHVLLELPQKITYKFDLTIILGGEQFDSYEAQTALNKSSKSLLLGQSEQLARYDHALPLWQQISPDQIITMGNSEPKGILEALFQANWPPNKLDIQFKAIDGRYDEATGTNQAEALASIDLLNTIKETPQRTFPKIAIITLTIGQRDLIYSYFLDIKQRQSVGYEKIQQLERNGLSVLHLSEIDQLEFDIIILNNTFTGIDLNGTSSQELNLLKKRKFKIQFTHLLNQSYDQFFVLDSLGEEFERWLLPSINIFSYFRTVLKTQDFSASSSPVPILEHKLVDTEIKQKMSEKLYFAQEVISIAKPLLNYHRLEVYQANKFVFPILKVFEDVTSALKFVIIIDGFLAESTNTDFEWELVHLEQYRTMDVEILRIWSIDWWKDYKSAAQALVEQIEKLV